jgi:hypothetical protein
VIISLLLIPTGNGAVLFGIMAVIAPLIALFLGLFGFQIYGRDTTAKDDRFNTFNYWLSIGLIILSLAEVAGILVSFSLDPQQMILTIALVQLPGLFLWGIGIIQYLQALNSAMGYVKTDQLWTGLFLAVILSTVGLIAVVVTQFPSIGIIESMVLSPIIVSLVLFSTVIGVFVVVFRKGIIARPLFLILGALLLYATRCILWLISDAWIQAPIDRVIAAEAFILCGIALLMSKNLRLLETWKLR